MCDYLKTLWYSFYHLTTSSIEEFGTAWAVDDEEECPKPEPPQDICEDFGLGADKAGYEAHVRSVLKSKLLTYLTLE